jgi:hypothetical protein
MANENSSRQRKSEAQTRLEEADNAGRFAGSDADAQAARKQAIENVKQDTNSTQKERSQSSEDTDAEARRDPAQTHDAKGEAQNINDDSSRPLTNEEAEHARNKAGEGIRQKREEQ